MASVLLPTLPRGAKCNPQPLEAGGPLLPIFGAGARQDMQRTGDRWGVEVSPPASTQRYASQVYGARMEAKRTGSTLTLEWPQPQFTLPIGSPKINGADQGGTTLIIDGVTPQTFLPAMTFFSVVGPTQDGLSTRNYLHMVTEDKLIGASGAATIRIWPMMRVVYDDNADLEFATPKIEGFIHTPADYSLEFRRFFGFPSFTIIENE